MVEQEEHETIIDESKTGFEAITDKGLVNFHSSDVRDGDRIVVESNRRLKKSINTFNEKASMQINELIILTQWIKWLTIALGLIALLQLILLFTQT